MFEQLAELFKNQIYNNTIHTNTLYTLLVTQLRISQYYNQPSPQTVQGQQTCPNPHSSSAETVEGQYMFGNPCSSSAVTVGVLDQQIFGNDCSSLVDIQKCSQYARRRLVTLAVALQSLSKASRCSEIPVQAPQGVSVWILE